MIKRGLCLWLLLMQSMVAVQAQGEGMAAASNASAEKQILATFTLNPAPAMPRAGRSGGFYRPAKHYRQSVFDDKKAERLAKRYQLKKIAEWPIPVLGVHCVVYESVSDEPLAKVIQRLATDSSVESVQAMNVFRVKSKAYNDPYFKLQHNLKSLQISSVHEVSTGKGVKVAVIDSGVDVDHPDLNAKVAIAKSFVSQDENIFNTDIHGTAVTGVIASAVNNGIGIIGIAPAVKIWALKACWQTKPSSSESVCNSFTLTQAISFAIEQGVDVVNLSLSGPEDVLLERIIRAAQQRGIVIITAYDQYNPFPASIERVIAVADNNLNASDLLIVSDRAVSYFLRAPGTDILTTLPNGHYDYLSGSSFAAAHVSGIVALLLEQQNNLTTEQIYQLLNDVDQASVNVCIALQRLLKKHACAMGIL